MRVALRVEPVEESARLRVRLGDFRRRGSPPLRGRHREGLPPGAGGRRAGRLSGGGRAPSSPTARCTRRFKEIAFQTAGREGFKGSRARKDQPVLLEPIYEVTVTVPADNMGDVLGDMNSRRARVLGMDQEGNKSIVRAEVPLAEMQSYATDLRSMTQAAACSA